MKTEVELKENEICERYKNENIGVESMAKEYHVGKKKIKDILLKNNIDIKKRGNQKGKKEIKVRDWKIEKYPKKEGEYYIAVDRNNGFTTKDYMNAAGVLTSHIKNEYLVEIPTLYDRREYYRETGNYWWEQWFDIKSVANPEVKKCPYCDWETVDIENKSGAFEMHIKKFHGINPEEHLKKFPEDEKFFKGVFKTSLRNNKLEKSENYVFCPICGKKFEKITEAHITKVHGLEWENFKKKYHGIKLLSDKSLVQTKASQKLGNLTVSKKRFISKYEKELQNFLTENNIEFSANRQILIGKEIDILIESKKIGIEFDGLKFHTEFFGRKSHRYHLEKTLKCNSAGYGLIHIFEDEYVNKKNIVYSKIKHILGLNTSLEKVGGRKCIISKINTNVAKDFLEKFHIQGFTKSTCYVGGFYKNELVGVMSFKLSKNGFHEYELTRFATDDKYQYQGLGSKMLKYFVRENNPKTIYSFADRRWTVDIHDNLYTKIGFILEKIGRPDYKYYNEKVEKYKRVHKMFMSKKILIKKHGFPETMTEIEMAKSLGYDRIWDCGLLKYVYTNPDYVPGNEEIE